MSKEFICDNLTQSSNGAELYFAGVSTEMLSKKYGTPLYIIDEDKVRSHCRDYKTAVTAAFGETARVMYASKAASFKRICEIINEEGLSIDVVSCGEIYTALKAGISPQKMYFHSNNKTDEDIDFALKNGVGHFVTDNIEELFAVNEIAQKYSIKQKIILRLTPGIDTHTFEAVNTGKVDSKFGSAIETGQAYEITQKALSLSNIELEGFHCHVGSMVFDSDVFIDSAEIMLNFIKSTYDKCGYMAKFLDLGGGYGVRYIKEQPQLNVSANINAVAAFIKNKCDELNIPVPSIGFEPGRSIVADAGLTLYTVGTVKNIPGYKTYVSVDGGMTDNIRYALYSSPYTILSASKLNESCDMPCSLVGRCCESGDIIQENISLPSSTKRGDIIACCTTGAYHYSMASNYNRLPKLPIVMLSGGKDYLAVKRETLDDLIKSDI